MRDMHRTALNFLIAFLLFLSCNSMLMAARKTRDLPSSANGDCTAIAGCEGSVIFLDKVGQIPITGDGISVVVELYRWGALGSPFTGPIGVGKTLIRVTASVSPGASNVQILGITAVGVQTTTTGPLANPWYAYIDPEVSSFSSLSPYSIFMTYPAGYSPADVVVDGDTTIPAVPDLISAPTPVTLADGNTTLWTFDPTSAVASALLQVDGFPDSAEPTSQSNVLSPSDYLSQTPLPTIASTAGNGLDSVTANNIAVVINLMSQGKPTTVSLGGLSLAGGLVACPNADPAEVTCLSGATLTNQPPPVEISSLNFSQLVRLDDLPVSTTQLTYTPTVEQSDTTNAPTCTQFLAQGPTSLARYVQYQYTPTTNQTVNIDTAGSHFDTVLLMTSSNDSSFTPACADDEDNGAVLQAALPLEPLQSGKTYTITAGEYPSFQEYLCNTSADCSAGSQFPAQVVNSPLSPDPVIQFAMTIQPEATATSVSCTPQSAEVDSPVNCMATVKDTSTPANTPTGSVQFKFTEGESSSPAETLSASLSNGVTSVMTSSLAAGSYTVTATLQPGSSQFQTSDGATPLTIASPVPGILSLSPMTVMAEGPSFTLTVNGFNFYNGSVVIWNSGPRATTYVSSTQLTAKILASDLVNAGSAMVTVFNDIAGGGTSPAATVTITPASQTISFPALPNVTYGVAPFALSATASSGLPVTFTISSGPAKIEDGLLTVTGVGLVVVVASQAGNANYSPAPPIPPQSFSVAQAPLSATCNSYFKIYATANPVLSGTIAGLQNGDTLTLTCSTTSVTASAAGSYAITPKLSGSALPNYQTTLHPGTLTVNKAPLTLTANSLSSSYGSAVPMLTYTLTGLVNGDTPTTAFTGAPSLSTTATPASKVGNYPIAAAAGTLVSQSYQVKFAPGMLTVTKAELLVIANSLSSVYGSKSPSLTSTISGFVNHDSASAISGEPVLSTTATSKSAVGYYTIACATGTLAAANYSFECVPGTLTIAKATLTLTVNNSASVYGAPYPVFTYVLSGFLNGDTAKTATSGAPHLATTPAAKYGTGAYPINATIGTLVSVNYDFDFVPGILNIAPAQLTITANDVIGFYGSNPPTFTYQITGYVNKDTTATAFTGVPSLTTTAAKDSPVGHYPITLSNGSLASNKYSFQFVPGTLTIAKAQLTVTANNVSSIYGSALPAFTYTLSGFHNGDTQKTAVTGAPSLSSTGNASSPVDTYPIVAETGTLASSNYKFKFVAGTLTIAKAPLTITASNASVAFDKPLPKFTYTTLGFVNGDTSSVLSGTPLETTTAKQGSAAGKYPITITQGTLTATNYSFTFNNGTLTITANGSVATPVFSPAGGTYAEVQSVTIKDETPGATICYALHGVAPTLRSIKYTGPIPVSASETIQAIAVAPGYADSKIASTKFSMK